MSERLVGLENINIVEELNDSTPKFDFRKHCMHEKHNHVQFYSRPHKSSMLSDFIHYDVFGPLNIPSISKPLYCVSFIDCSRRTWVYFLISKFKVFSQFMEFKALLEN
jgi:hypothetical protein